MQRLKIIKVENVLLAISFLIQIITGLLIFFRVRGAISGISWEVHEYNGFILVGLVLWHVALHWPLVKSHYFSKK